MVWFWSWVVRFWSWSRIIKLIMMIVIMVVNLKISYIMVWISVRDRCWFWFDGDMIMSHCMVRRFSHRWIGGMMIRRWSWTWPWIVFIRIVMIIWIGRMMIVRRSMIWSRRYWSGWTHWKGTHGMWSRSMRMKWSWSRLLKVWIWSHGMC